ncbi:hypothetical protein N836_30850 [Leptolyngbya sp. Heron Island J]|uniref:hypothetical protein n=1 Tax=Leptolyngbya sp. Heron Island J TaxID=1385935 RepID=UPI0003B93EA8|nr:hypothetical protein [Leptolyngbya sp. Heron Island J]ESA38719.1 hypothetical protein N836_30850 [Leptolyngbya sp. Heron Island J]
MKPRRQRATAGDKTIYIAVPEDIDYPHLVSDRKAFRRYLDQMIVEHPELFPAEIS